MLQLVFIASDLSVSFSYSVGGFCLVSWSPKGKQLAICLNGSLSTANGIVQGPLILQVDPQLQQKRIVPLGHLFESNHGK